MGKHYRYSRDIPAFPAQWVDGLYVLSPVSGVCCHRCLQDTSRKIDATVAAPGPHDFAVRCERFVRRASPPDAAASIATRANVPRRSRSVPFWRRGLGGPVPVICPTGQATILIFSSRIRENGIELSLSRLPVQYRNAQ